MNYHSDKWIMDRLQEHYNEALESFPEDRIVCLALQGSQNYGLDTLTSDIDTKLVVCPTFYDIAMNRQPVSTTHVRENNEHIDFKDVRLMLKTFRKANLNFLEILFSNYCIINPLYVSEWNRLIAHNEEIARYDKLRAIKSMEGLAHRKFANLENRSPSHEVDIKKFGYSPKELHHLLRIEEYLERYISGESYSNCLLSKQADYLKDIKSGILSLDEARILATHKMSYITNLCNAQERKWDKNDINEKVNELLDDVQYKIMEIAIKKELL